MMYELFYLLPTRYTDAEAAGIMDKVGGMIAKAGGEVKRNEMLGRLKLAYPIATNHHGIYVLAHFSAEPAVINPLDRQLRLTEEILRHQLTVMPKGADKKKYDLSAYVPPLSDEGRPEMSAFRGPRTAAPAKAEEATMDVGTINKKLDDMLTEDVSKQA